MNPTSREKILFVEMVSPLGHMDVNYFFIKHVFPHIHAYQYLVERNLYQRIVSHYDLHEKLPVEFFPQFSKGKSRVAAHYREFQKLAFVLDFMQRNGITNVYFLSYHTLSLSCYASRFKDVNVILMNHDNISRFTRSFSRKLIWGRLRDFTHVVYASSGNTSDVDRLYQGIGLKDVLTVEHNIDESRTIFSRRPYVQNAPCLYAPSNGNDAEKILTLLRSIGSGNITIRAKVDAKTFSRNRARFTRELFCGIVDRAAFEEGMNNTDYVLLLFPDDYIFRTSGTLFDAIAYEKPVVTDSRFLYGAYLKKSGLGVLVSSARSVAETVSRIDRLAYEGLVENIRNFKRSYSAEKIGSDFAASIERVMER